LEGAVLVLGLVALTAFSIMRSRRETVIEGAHSQTVFEIVEGGPRADRRRGASFWALQAGFVLCGLGLLAVGCEWFVDGAVFVARALGLSELVVGLTVVSLGTSLPEMATSVVAALKGQREIAIGNVVGSNLINILGVLGAAVLVSPQGVSVSPGALAFDIPVMFAVAVACLPTFFTGYVIARLEGAVFLAYYACYVGYLVLTAQEHAALPVFSLVMRAYVIPLTILGIGLSVWHSIRRSRRA